MHNCLAIVPRLWFILSLLVVCTNANVVGAQTQKKAIETLHRITAQKEMKESYLDLVFASERVMNPKLDEKYVRRFIKKMAAAVREAIDEETNPRNQLQALNKVVFRDFRFDVPSQPSDPFEMTSDEVLRAYMLHRFIKHKEAYCAGLSMVYFLVGREAKLPVSICNAPMHCYCEFQMGKGKKVGVECTARGVILPQSVIPRLLGAKPAAANSGVYFRPLTKKKFLAVQLNSLCFAAASRKKGKTLVPQPDLVKLADLMVKLDPQNPESLDTAALVYHKASLHRKALDTMNKAFRNAKTFGNIPKAYRYYSKMQKKYQKAVDALMKNAPKEKQVKNTNG